ncbi:MAG: hypothetical protein Q9195_004157 [Heterodermia aff. obscurata]
MLCSLPAELVGIVLNQLEREDLFNVRTICKAMSCYVNPFVFRKLHVWFEEQSLQSLINIASDPVLGKNVREVVIGMDYFYDVEYDQFKKHICFSDHRYGPTVSPKRSDRAQRKDIWRVYRTCYRKQCALEESGRDLAMMTQALRGFPSLVEVRLIDYQHWLDEFKAPRLLKTEKLRKHMLTAPDERLRIPRGGQQIRVLLQALAASGRKIEELTLDTHSSNISISGYYGTLPEGFDSITVQALSGLKRLGFTLDPIEIEMLVQLKMDSQELSLTTILRAATQLESLWVHLPPFGNVPWNDYIQVPRVGQLKELFVSEVYLHEADFALFLRSSCQGLRKFYLRKAMVKGNSWDLIFETIRSLPNLETVELEGLWYRTNQGGRRF